MNMSVKYYKGVGILTILALLYVYIFICVIFVISFVLLIMRSINGASLKHTVHTVVFLPIKLIYAL